MQKEQENMSADQQNRDEIEKIESIISLLSGSLAMAPRNDPTTADNTKVEEADLQEMQDVNNSLDELSNALDFFEERTDNIIEQLKELLHSNREIRQQIAQENADAVAGGDGNNAQ